MPVTTLTDLRTKREKAPPALGGTGATMNGGGQLTHQLSPTHLQLEAPKLAEQQARKLYIQGDSVKCSIVSGHVTSHGEIRFEGKTAAPAHQPPKDVVGVGADVVAAVIIAGTVNRSVICESLETKGIVFGDDDDD